MTMDRQCVTGDSKITVNAQCAICDDKQTMNCDSGDDGWQMIVVGGGRRSLPSHDGDFVITHPTR